MRSRKTIMGFGLLAAVLFLAVGYAAISNIDFSITGTASAEVDTGLFEVAFDKDEEKTTTSNTGTTATVTASVTGDQSAEFVVSGLKKKNETVTATYTIKNSSDTLDAKLSEPIVTLSGDTTSFYDVTAVYGNGSEETPILEVDDTITLTVTVKMKKTPIDTVNDVKPVTISISFSAEPIQPGSEGSGGSSSGSLPETEDPVYYGKHYIMEDVSGTRGSVIFYEDGSFETYADCILNEDMGAPAGAVSITNNKILLMGTEAGTVSADKKTVNIYEYGEFTLLENGTCAGEFANLPMITSAMNLLGFFEENNINRQKVNVVTLGNSINIPEGVNAVDISYAQNGKVMMYVIPNDDDTYDMYVEGDGGLYAPRNSMGIFSSSATEINNLNLLDTSYVVNMEGMFDGTEVSSLDLSNFDTSKVTNMSYMFNYTENLTSLDLSSFDTSKVTDMSWMFNSTGYNSTEFTLNLGGNFDTSNVTNMEGMFQHTGYNSTEFTLNLGDNFDTSKVTDMSSVFNRTGYNSTEFTLNLGNNFNTSNVTDMSSMFYQTGLNSTKFALDCSEWNVDNVTNYSSFNYGVENKVTAPTWKN